ncbi:MAG: transcriptional repressor [Candidatus Aminicenantes bacterium]|nr:transcriptional repressor [Candidatus Aminicenantes bacterium]
MKIKNSKQREAIFEALNAQHCHPTVDEIYDLVRKKYPRISLATVYRNLELLHRQGKIQKIESAGAPVRYDCEMVKHFHIKCRKCGCVGDVMIEKKLEDYIDLQNAAADFTVTGYRIDFFGFCPQCKESAT